MSVRTTVERIVFEGQDRISGPSAAASKAVNNLRSSLDSVKGALGALGVTVGAGAMVALHMDTLKAVAALDDMSESTGASVEGLSAIQRVAKVGGHDFEGLTAQIGKMLKGLKDGGEEGSKTARALAHLGISTRDTNGNFRDTSEIVVDLSEKLARYKDDGDKVRLVQDALGRGAERYLPLLKDMADKTDLFATVTAKQAAEAEKAEKSINRLKVQMEDSRRELVINFLPAIQELTTELSKGVKVAGGFGNAIMTLGTINPFRTPGENIAAYSTEIEELTKARDKFASMQGYEGQVAFIDRQIEANRVRIAFLKEMRKLEVEQALSLGGADSLDARDLRARGGSSRESVGYTGDTGRLSPAEIAKKQQEGQEAFNDYVVKSDAEMAKHLDAQQRERIENSNDLEGKAQQHRLRMADELTLKADEDFRRSQERAAAEIERIQSIGRTEEQVATLRYNARRQLIEQSVVDGEDKQAYLEALEYEHQQEMVRLEDEGIKRRFGIAQVHRKMDLGAAQTFLGSMQGLMNSGSKKMFEIGKAAAIANAIIDTYKAATGAYAALASIPIVGPALGAAAAAAAVVAGLANVRAIKAQQFGGGSGATPTYPASPTTGLPAGQPGGGAAPAGGGSARQTTVINLGNRRTISRDELRDLFDAINEEFQDGGRFVIA